VNNFRLSGLIRQIEPDSDLGYQVLLQTGPRQRYVGFGPHVTHTVVLTVPGLAAHLLNRLMPGDVVAVRGKVRGVWGDGEPNIAPESMPPALPFSSHLVQLVVHHIARVPNPPMPAYYSGVEIVLNPKGEQALCPGAGPLLH
jgi:hypothetical protein